MPLEPATKFSWVFSEIAPNELHEKITQSLGCSDLKIPEQDRAVKISGTYIRVNGVSLRRMRYHGSVNMDMHLEDDAISFTVTTDGKLALNSPIDALATTSAAVAMEKSRMRKLNVIHQHEHYGASIPYQLLIKRLSTLLEKPISSKLSFALTVNLEPLKLQALTGLLKILTSNDYQVLATQSSLTSRHLQEMLVDGILDLWPHNRTEAIHSPTPSISPRHVKIAIDQIEACPQQCFSASELAELAGVGVRALQQGFKKFTSTSILNYQRSVRLKHCHSDLISRPGDSVSEIAYRWGFSNTSRFTEYFQKAYGITPIELRGRDK